MNRVGVSNAGARFLKAHLRSGPTVTAGVERTRTPNVLSIDSS